MKLGFIGDMHGTLDFSVDPCDLLVIVGDICPCGWDPNMSCITQEHWLDTEFREWLGQQPIEECVSIGGNHDWIWDIAYTMVPKMNKNFHYLCDESIELLGLKIYGTPQQKVFNNWAFNRTTEQLERYFANIPEGLDILITHTAPYGIMDFVDCPRYKGHEGDRVLEARLKALAQPPKINAFGHFHGEYGVMEVIDLPGIKFVNCSLVSEQYIRNKNPIYLEI